MGVFQNNLLAGAAAAASSGAAGFYDYQIEQSMRLDGAESLYKTFSGAGSGGGKTGTFSCWLKRATSDTTEEFLFNFNKFSADGLRFLGDGYGYLTGVSYVYRTTPQLFRAVGGWSHIVFRIDMTQSTAADRVRLYLNGNQLTFTTTTYTNLSINTDVGVFQNIKHEIGKQNNGSGGYLKGYIAECIGTDGQSYAPTQFAEEKNGVWIPKDPTGTTFGTNGFHLKFENASDLGNDSSGNNNDFTTNGSPGTDHQVLDSPTFGS